MQLNVDGISLTEGWLINHKDVILELLNMTTVPKLFQAQSSFWSK